MPTYSGATAIVGPGTPYITPALLIAAPSGISWSTIPNARSTPAQQTAEQLNICQRATSMVDAFCNTPLRATIDTEVLTGPGDFRFQIRRNGVARMVLSRPPVVSVLSGQVTAAATFPPQWNPIAGNQFKVERPLMGLYGTTSPGASGDGGQAVLLAPGNVSWMGGRYGYDLEVTYLNGWPHCSLTQPTVAGDTTLAVDDIAGWGGASGIMYDAIGQENVFVTAITPTVAGALTGPGSLTLAQGVSSGHATGTMLSTLPGSVIQAAIYLAISQALTRGSTAISAQTMSGALQNPGGGVDHVKSAHDLLQPYRRVL